MSDNKPIKKDLFILGNGFDLALDLKSDFSNYIENENNGRNYSKVLHFIKMFNEYTVKLTLLSHPRMIWDLVRHYRIRYRNFETRMKLFKRLSSPNPNIKQRLALINKLLSIKMTKISSNSHINKYAIHFFVNERNRIIKESLGNGISDFLNIKLLLNNSNYKYWLSKRNNSNSKVNTQINRIADRWFHKLVNFAKSINNINFWDLIIIFQKKYANERYSQSFNDWCDIENTIKYFLTSICNEPEYKNGQFHVSKLNYYFNDTNKFFRGCFQSYFYVNIYLKILINIESNNQFSLNETTIYSDNLYNNVKSSVNNHCKYLSKSVPEPNFFDMSNDESDVSIFHIDINYLEDPIRSKSFIFLLQILFKHDVTAHDLFSVNFLSKQLKLFEKSFAKYLKSGDVIPYSKSEYVKRSFMLLQNLFMEINNKLQYQKEFERGKKKFEVIDFNYTKLDSCIRPREHIHGSLDTNNIIIGMGDTEINNLMIMTKKNNIKKHIHEKIISSNMTEKDGNHEDKRMRKTITPVLGFTESKYLRLLNFTKTYRILEMMNKDDNYSFENKSFDNIDNIIFFGHSLGINDYPYFEAIFDRVQLYDSNVRLIFCYNKHSINDKSVIPYKNEQITAIVNLLRRYGRTMNNRAHGDNLISKMLIENRIRFFDATDCVENALGIKHKNKYFCV